MRRCLVGTLVLLVVALASVVPADAAGFRGRTIVKKRTWFSKTVTTSVYTADLTNDGSTPPQGTATYTVTTIDVRIFWQTWTSTCVTLTVDVNGLDTTSVPDGTVLAFYNTLNGSEQDLLGTADVSGGAASLSLSSKKGDFIPDLSQSVSGIEVDVANDGYLVSGDFGPKTVTTTTCGSGGGSSGGTVN